MMGDQIKHAREFNGLTQTMLAEQVGVQQYIIAYIERNARVPSDELLGKISEVTGFPVTFFEESPESEFPLGSLLYRKFNYLSSQDRTRSYRLAWQSYYLHARLSKRLRTIPLRIPKNIEEDPITAARLVRSAIGCDPESPLKNLINKIERQGIIVLMLTEEIEGLDAFSTWVDGTRPVIMLSPGRPGDRQRLSTAHELGHLVLHQSFRGGFEGLEREANQFAAELLLPDEAMRREMIPPITLSILAELKRRWGTSIQALTYRARELGIITLRQEKYLWTQISKRWGKKQEPDALYIPPEKPRALRKMAEILYGEPIHYNKLATETHSPVFWVKSALDQHATKEDLELSFRNIN
jgi:Zn-dependent peptidase ImmA (M78 family)/DNA-binding XRE family transcriptional regulator